MMPELYRIRDWNSLFETHETRKYKVLRYVTVPNKLDGDGYTQLVTGHDDGPLHYAAWLVMLLVASKCSPRGTLVRGNGKPHDPESLSRVTRLPERAFAMAMPRLANEIGWLEVVCTESDVPSSDPAEVPSCSDEIQPLPQERDNLPEARETVPDLSVKRLPILPTGLDITDHTTAAGSGAAESDLEKKSGTKLRALDSMKHVHLMSDRALEALRDQLAVECPEKFKKNDNCLLAILAAAERAQEIGKKPIALFVSIVRDQQWAIISDEQHARAAQRLKEYRRRQTAEGVAK